MANIELTVNEDGSALLDLSGGGEIRESVALDEVPDGPPALESIVLHFDFYGRLARIEITDSVASVLPPAFLDSAKPEVDAAVAAIEREDWEALKPLLHPYLHWGDGHKGRSRLLDHLRAGGELGPPLDGELRDGQIYRW